MPISPTCCRAWSDTGVTAFDRKIAYGISAGAPAAPEPFVGWPAE